MAYMDDQAGRDTIRIIIAEDHAVVREGTRQLLEREADFEIVGEAANGLEAVALVTTQHPDVAIVDISMPVMGGIEATERIKAIRPTTASSPFAASPTISKSASRSRS